MVSIGAFQVLDPGSIPGIGTYILRMLGIGWFEPLLPWMAGTMRLVSVVEKAPFDVRVCVFLVYTSLLFLHMMLLNLCFLLLIPGYSFQLPISGPVLEILPAQVLSLSKELSDSNDVVREFRLQHGGKLLRVHRCLSPIILLVPRRRTILSIRGPQLFGSWETQTFKTGFEAAKVIGTKESKVSSLPGPLTVSKSSLCHGERVYAVFSKDENVLHGIAKGKQLAVLYSAPWRDMSLICLAVALCTMYTVWRRS